MTALGVIAVLTLLCLLVLSEVRRVASSTASAQRGRYVVVAHAAVCAGVALFFVPRLLGLVL